MGKAKRKRDAEPSLTSGPGGAGGGDAPNLDAPVTARSSLPFETVASDHAETPSDAYADVAPLLDAIARRRGLCDRRELRIYDPYYCAGGVVRKLGALGVTRVRNAPVDCYAEWAAEEDAAAATAAAAAAPPSSTRARPPPAYDVLLTNPPYSGDHPRRLCDYLARRLAPRGVPWLLLVPSWVACRPYFEQLTNNHRAAAEAAGDAPPAPTAAGRVTADTAEAYIVPHKRYAYLPPAWAVQHDAREGGGGAAAAAAPATTAPFVSLWCCGSLDGTGVGGADGGQIKSAALAAAATPSANAAARAACTGLNAQRVRVVHSLAELPNDARDVTDPAKRRLNPKARQTRGANAAHHDCYVCVSALGARCGAHVAAPCPSSLPLLHRIRQTSTSLLSRGGNLCDAHCRRRGSVKLRNAERRLPQPPRSAASRRVRRVRRAGRTW